MVVNHQFCMAAHSAEKDLCTATKGALVRSLSVVPLAGEEGVPSRFSEPLGKGHLRLGDIEDIARQPMQRTTRHHHVAAGCTNRCTGRPHAVSAGKAGPHPDQTVQRWSLYRFIPQRPDGVRSLIIRDNPENVGNGIKLNSIRGDSG